MDLILDMSLVLFLLAFLPLKSHSLVTRSHSVPGLKKGKRKIIFYYKTFCFLKKKKNIFLPDVVEHKFFLVLTITLFGLGQVIPIPFVPEAKS
jgi:hypothetical protein